MNSVDRRIKTATEFLFKVFPLNRTLSLSLIVGLVLSVITVQVYIARWEEIEPFGQNSLTLLYAVAFFVSFTLALVAGIYFLFRAIIKYKNNTEEHLTGLVIMFLSIRKSDFSTDLAKQGIA